MQVNLAGAAGFFAVNAAADNATPTEGEVKSFPIPGKTEVSTDEVDQVAMEKIMVEWLTKLSGFKTPPQQLNNIKFPQGNPEAQDNQPIAETKKQDGAGNRESKVKTEPQLKPWSQLIPWADVVPPASADVVPLPVFHPTKPAPSNAPASDDVPAPSADNAPGFIVTSPSQDVDFEPYADTVPQTLPVTGQPVYKGESNVDVTPYDGAWEAKPRPTFGPIADTTPEPAADTVPIFPTPGKKPISPKPATSPIDTDSVTRERTNQTMDKNSFRNLWNEFRTKVTELSEQGLDKMRQVVTDAIQSGVPMREIAKVLANEFQSVAKSLKNGDSLTAPIGKIVSLIEQLAETTPKQAALIFQHGFPGNNKSINLKFALETANADTTPIIETTKEQKTDSKTIESKPVELLQTTTKPTDKTVAETKPEVKSEPSKVMQRVVEQIQTMLESKRPRTITLRLDPPELGSLQISIKTIGNQVETKILATNGDVRNMVENGKEQLIQMLNSRGLELGAMHVGTQSQNQNQSQRTITQDTTPTWRPEVSVDSVASVRSRHHDGLDLNA